MATTSSLHRGVWACIVALAVGSVGGGTRPHSFEIGQTSSDVGVRRLTYHGWSNSIRLSNGSVEMVIVPAIGRIMRFAPVGGANVLWVNPGLLGRSGPPSVTGEWLNFGGDKLWPAPQDRWGWPPDPELDGSPWQASVRSDGAVVMESARSSRSGIRFRRTISVHPTRPEARVLNELRNEGNRPVAWSVWQITQVDDPEWASMARSTDSSYESGCRLFPESPPPDGSVTVTSSDIRAHRHKTQAYKIGADPRRTILRSQHAGWTFTAVGPDRAKGDYPDGGCNVEIYSNPDPLPYMELEALGPVLTVAPKRSVSLRTVWSLRRSQRNVR